MRKDLIWGGLLVKNMSKGPNRLIFQIINPMPPTILQNSVNNNTSPPCFPSTRLATQHEQFTSLLPSPIPQNKGSCVPPKAEYYN